MLAGCLDSIRRQTWADWRVIVVDNGSIDGSADWLRTHHPEVQLIALAANTGFSPAVNLGIRAGSRPLVFLLNNDTELAPDCLEQLVRAAETQPDHAFFAPRMLSFHQRHLLDGAGEATCAAAQATGWAPWRRTGPPMTGRARCSAPAPGPRSTGGSRSRRWAGSMTPSSPTWRTWTSTCARAWPACAAGTCPRPGSTIIGSATSGSKFNDLTIRLSTRNSLWVLAKNYPAGLLALEPGHRRLPGVVARVRAQEGPVAPLPGGAGRGAARPGADAARLPRTGRPTGGRPGRLAGALWSGRGRGDRFDHAPAGRAGQGQPAPAAVPADFL